MSADDARRVGETIRQLFFDARMKLPQRVVIHKRTAFTKQEREGLRDGLSGVDCVEMLEIRIDHALRYVASIQKRDGTPDEDSFPVWRGTVMKLDDYSALMWVHGATKALNPRLKYFQGKRRIPCSAGGHTLCRKDADSGPRGGNSRAVKDELEYLRSIHKITGYLQSSGEIAKIGSLLQRFGTASYDYRLFI